MIRGLVAVIPGNGAFPIYFTKSSVPASVS
jgi:hypothetical protein